MAKKNASSGSGSLVGFIAGIILSMIGLFVSPILLIAGIVLIVQNKGALAGKTEKSATYKSAPSKPAAAAGRSVQPRPAQAAPVRTAPQRSSGASYQAYSQDHYHITNAGLSTERRLEQLEVMKNAGLLDKEEYQQRLQKILRDK